MTIVSFMKQLICSVAWAVAVYAVILGLLLEPRIQRFALYAHKVNTLWLFDLGPPESFGFSQNQVTPFSIQTPDGEALYVWHVLPLDLYVRHEDIIRHETRDRWQDQDLRNQFGFNLLKQDSNARVVISFHGNAGHIAQGWRADTLRLLASQPNTHVFTLDYRGFGYSTGSPSEAGLITDGITLTKWVMDNAEIPADRIIILGQSLGTAVAAAVALFFVHPESQLLPDPLPQRTDSLRRCDGSLEPITFARIILVAAFSSIPSLLWTYRLGGTLPLLLPLRPLPSLVEALVSRVADQWRTADRLLAYYTATRNHLYAETASRRATGTLCLIHALNDLDISHKQSRMMCQSISDLALSYTQSQWPQVGSVYETSVAELAYPGAIRVRCEFPAYGGHNRIVTSSTVLGSILSTFDSAQPL